MSRNLAVLWFRPASTAPKAKRSREECEADRSVRCPSCGVDAGKLCRSPADRERYGAHVARVRAARAMVGGP